MIQLKVFILCTLTWINVIDSATVAHVDQVMKYLFTNQSYNKKIRPVNDQSTALDIWVDFFLNSIIDFNEQEGSITTAGYLQLSWNDVSLVWNSTLYNDVDALFIPQNDIWKPDISLRNSYGTFTGLGADYYNVWFDSTGFVYWQPFQVFKSTCDVDIKYFPFDIQTCKLKFLAWSYTKKELNLVIGKQGIEMQDYNSNSVWNLVWTNADTENEKDDAVVVYTLVLKRKPLYYLINVLFPTVLLSTLDVFIFVLPVTSSERASFAITVFLSFAVFNTIVNSQLPVNSDTTSLLGIYLVTMNTISTAIVIISLLELRLESRKESKEPICNFYKGLHKFVEALRCRMCRGKRKVSDSVVSFNRQPLSWLDVINSIDILLFWTSLLITFVATVGLLIVSSTGAEIPKS